MRILIISNILSDPKTGGWGRYSYEIAHWLEERGHEVVVLCHKKNPNIEDIEQIEVLSSDLLFKRVYILSFLYVIKAWISLRKQKPFDVIHCMVEPYAFITYLLSQTIRVPYILTIHGSRGILMLYSLFYKRLQMQAYKSASKIITVSNYTKKRLAAWSIVDTVQVIPTGVAVEKFQKLEGVARNPYQIISVGAVKERKGYHVSLEAFARVYKEYTEARYVIVGDQGDTEYVSRLKSIISDHHMEDAVSFYENISDEELNKLYAQSSVFVLISQSHSHHFEGFGVVFLEANLLGLPSVGSLDCGAEDAIKEGESGFLVHQDNPEEIAGAIKKLFANQALYTVMSPKAVVWAQSFSWDIIVGRLIDTYRDYIR